MIQGFKENRSENTEMISRVILSGRRIVHNQFMDYAGVNNKALIEIRKYFRIANTEKEGRSLLGFPVLSNNLNVLGGMRHEI